MRWFLLCDGRAGLRLEADGTPAGLGESFFDDVDAGLDLARQHGLRVMFALMDFLWFGRPRLSGGVQMGGRRALVSNARKQAALLERVVRPILIRYGRQPTVWAWDVMNEPEWATFGLGSRNLMVSLRVARMRVFLGRLVDQVHRLTVHPVTVGLASARGLRLVRDLGLDFYQVHWYDSVERRAPLGRPVASLGLDRPLLLGEFPTAGSSRSAEAILEASRRSGYAGALAWSVLGADGASDFAAAEPVLAGWAEAGRA